MNRKDFEFTIRAIKAGDIDDSVVRYLRTLAHKLDSVICPGCGTVLAPRGHDCTNCGYEMPNNIPSVIEMITSDDEEYFEDFDDVNLRAFLKAIFR